MHLEKGKRKNGSKLKQVENHIKTTDVVHIFFIERTESFCFTVVLSDKENWPTGNKNLTTKGCTTLPPNNYGTMS